MKDRAQVIEDLQEYNKEEFHLRHGLTVGAVMKFLAQDQGYGEEADFWEQVGLLHDIDFEQYPEEHCTRAEEILRNKGYSEELIHGVVSHGYGICSDVEPSHQMEKILFAADELTGLVWSAALVRPSKSTKDMKLKSLKKKFKDKKFAAGVDRDIIIRGAENLGWELDELFGKVLLAMQETEDDVEQEYQELKF